MWGLLFNMGEVWLYFVVSTSAWEKTVIYGEGHERKWKLWDGGSSDNLNLAGPCMEVTGR
jgi:hypothetical protein